MDVIACLTQGYPFLDKPNRYVWMMRKNLSTGWVESSFLTQICWVIFYQSQWQSLLPVDQLISLNYIELLHFYMFHLNWTHIPKSGHFENAPPCQHLLTISDHHLAKNGFGRSLSPGKWKRFSPLRSWRWRRVLRDQLQILVVQRKHDCLVSSMN